MCANRLVYVGETTCYHLKVLIQTSQIETRLIQKYFLSVILLNISNVKISKKMSSRPLDKSLSCAEKPSSGLPCSWTPLIRPRSFRIPRSFELTTVSFGFTLHSFIIGYFELPQFRTIFRFSCEFERARS